MPLTGESLTCPNLLVQDVRLRCATSRVLVHWSSGKDPFVHPPFEEETLEDRLCVFFSPIPTLVSPGLRLETVALEGTDPRRFGFNWKE